jgi:replicative DNA helicase
MNTESTGAKVLQALEAYDLKPDGTRQWRCNSPLRTGSNSHAFRIVIDDDGEHGAFHDFVSGEKGSLYEIADHLNIARPALTQVESTKRGYKGRADYAQAHGITDEVLAAAGYVEVEHNKRPALEFPTAGGKRYRFIDGAPDKPTYISLPGFKPCWYGLKRAVSMGSTLIITNGEISVVTAQHYGMAACALAGGERKLPDNLLAELVEAYIGRILIVGDCDEKGRRVSADIEKQLKGAGYTDVHNVDLKFSKGGDLADFCKLNPENTLEKLLKLLPPPIESDALKIEKALIATVMHGGEEARMRARRVKPEMFFEDKRHQVIWAALLRAEACSPRMIREKLIDTGKLDEAGGVDYLKELYAYPLVKTETASALASRIIDAAQRRIGAETVESLKSLFARNDIPAQDLIPTAITKLRSASVARGKDITTQEEADAEFFADLEGAVHGEMFTGLPIPFPSMREFGGLAELMLVGKILFIIAGTGAGKTSLVETLIEFWLRRGYWGTMWGPEWTAMEYRQRAVQRHAGIPIIRFAKDKLWRQEEVGGVPEHARYGYPLEEDDRARAREVLEAMQKWPGRVTYLTTASGDITVVNERISEVAADSRAEGKRQSFAVWDYTQMMNAKGRDERERLAAALASCKQTVIDNGLVGVVISQVTKQDSRRVAKGMEKLTIESMQNARGDSGNLAIAIQRVSHGGVMSDLARCAIVKNSLGSTGEFDLILDGKRLRYVDPKDGQ